LQDVFCLIIPRYNFPMRILVAVAIEAEFAPWRRMGEVRVLRGERGTAGAGRVAGSAKWREAEVDFVVSGMGAGNAREAARKALEASDYQMCISAGLSGALSRMLAAGEVVVAERVRRMDEGTAVTCDAYLVEQAATSGARRVATSVTAGRIVHSATEKAELARLGEVVDMESYEVAAAAKERGIPVVVIRSISDTATDELPAGMETLVDEFGRAKVGAALWMVVKRPWTLRGLMRLGRDSKDAAEKLAYFVKGFIEQIAMQNEALAKSDLHGIAAR
jgi:adenosylhomocysteine nucleosidase